MTALEIATIEADDLKLRIDDLEFHLEFTKTDNEGLKDRLVTVEDLMTRYQMETERY